MKTASNIRKLRRKLAEMETFLTGLLTSASPKKSSRHLAEACQAIRRACRTLDRADHDAGLPDMSTPGCNENHNNSFPSQRDVSLLSLLEHSFDAIYLRNLQNDQYDYISPVIEQITGFSADEFQSMKVEEVINRIHPDDHDKVIKTLDRVKDGGKEIVEYRFKGKDGTYKWLLDSIYVHSGSNVRPPCRIGIVRDITTQKEMEQSLREGEERFRLLAENIDQVFWFYDLEQQQMVYISPAFERIWGVSTNDIYANGKLWLEYIHPDDRSRVRHALDQWHAGSMNEYYIEYRIIRPDNEFRWISDHGTVIGHRQGKPCRVCGISKDISKRKEVEAELVRANERLELALCDASVWDWDITTGAIEWGANLFELFGLDPAKDQAGFEAWQNVLHPDDLQIATEQIYKAIRDGSMLENEYRIVRPDGKIRWISALGRTSYDNFSGEPLRMVGICIDITKRREAEMALRRSEDRYRSLVEMSPDALFINKDNRIIFMNNEGLKLFGASSPRQVLGKSPFDVFHQDYHELIRQRIARMLKGDIAPLIEEKIIRLDGSTVDVEVAAAPIEMDEGVAIQVILRDISERKKAEEKLLDRQQQLEELNRTLEIRVDEETRKNREKDYLLIQQNRQAELGVMINSIAHQWRQPLNVIGLYAQNLKETYTEQGKVPIDCLDDTVKGIVDLVLYMSQTINDFRDFLKPDSERRSFNVTEKISKTFNLISEGFKLQNIMVEIVGEDDVFATGYENQFAQVVMNILNNAKDVLTEREISSPKISIHVAREGNRSIVTITDNAGGIENGIFDRIFDLYFTTRESTSGTGIGLYTAKIIVEKNMQGRLTARNVAGGAAFRIEI